MDQKEQPKYACCLCDRTFIYKEVMNMHSNIMHSTPTRIKTINKHSAVNKKIMLPCPYKNCNVTCNSKNITRHIRADHEPLNINREGCKKINMSKICPHCGKTLSVSSLRAHIKHVHTGQINLCSKCTFSTKNISTLKEHFKRKHTSYKSSCEFCGKTVKDIKGHLRSTMCGKEVDDRNVLQCPKCPIQVRTKSQLKWHVSHIHDRIKDKQCTLCSYQTYSSFNLKLHVSKVHDKISIYKDCPHCHIRSGNLKKHLETYHVEQA